MSSTPPQSPLFNRWLRTMAFILAALGVPVAAIVSFTHFLTEHIWLAVIIGLVYEIFVFALGFFGEVLQQLRKRWVPRTVDRVDHQMSGLLSGYKKRYCRYLMYRHRDFDVKGLSFQGTFALELDQVFIELSIDTISPWQMMPTNPIPQELHKGSHTIWNFLASPFLAKQHLVIVGSPGSGKTTLLKHITLMLLAHGKSHEAKIRVPRKLPILLFLREHAIAIHTSASKDKPNFTLVDALHDHLKRWEQPDPPTDWVKSQLDSGRCLVLLDGLDEVADPLMRKEVVSWVETQMTAFSKNRFIITSRPFGFRDNPLNGVVMLKTCSFTAEQVERFIHKWYLANEIMSKQKNDPGVQMQARMKAKDLLQQLHHTPALLDLTVNPLLLTMITIVHRYGIGGKLPELRVSLYADICKVFLGKRQEAKEQQLELKPEQMQDVLEPLAFYMMQNNTRDIAPAQVRTVIEEPLGLINAQMLVADFLKLVENVSGLLLENENGLYRFAHLTFQEYLAATYIQKKQLVNTLIKYIDNSWWHETIRLYCAMADATPIITTCLSSDRPSAKSLILAFDCQKERLKVHPEVEARLETILTQGAEDTDPERQHIIAEVLLERRLRQMVHLKENTFADTSFITCIEYQLFLDEQVAQGKYCQPDHWKDYRFSPGQAHAPILGIRPADAAAFCTWLNRRETKIWFYRLPKADELKNAEDKSIINRLPAKTGYWLDQNSRFEWVKTPVDLTRTVVQESIYRDRALARALGKERDLALARAIERIRELNLICARDLEHDLIHAHDCDLALDLEHDLYFDLKQLRDRARILDRARNRNRNRDVERSRVL